MKVERYEWLLIDEVEDEEPTKEEEAKVDLRKAINEPMEPSAPHTIDLRKAIQQ